VTEAERRVAHLIADGHSNKSAAAELFLSPSTVAPTCTRYTGKPVSRHGLQLSNLVAEHR